MLKVEVIQQSLFFNRNNHQLSKIESLGLDNKAIWNVFCELTKTHSKKQWLISKKDLDKLNKISDEELYQAIGMAISKFFKGSYKGKGI